jgi:hypothetical protein
MLKARLTSYNDMDRTKTGQLCGVNPHELSGYKPEITVHPSDMFSFPNYDGVHSRNKIKRSVMQKAMTYMNFTAGLKLLPSPILPPWRQQYTPPRVILKRLHERPPRKTSFQEHEHPKSANSPSLVGMATGRMRCG